MTEQADTPAGGTNAPDGVPTQQALIAEGINYVLAKYGEPSVAI